MATLSWDDARKVLTEDLTDELIATETFQVTTGGDTLSYTVPADRKAYVKAVITIEEVDA